MGHTSTANNLHGDIFVQQQVVENKALAEQFDRHCKEVAESIDSKDLAAANDVTYAYIRKMLNTNSAQSPMQMDIIPSLARMNPDKFAETVLRFLCDLCGREVPEKKRSMTPEEELKIIRLKMKSSGLTALLKEWGLEG